MEMCLKMISSVQNVLGTDLTAVPNLLYYSVCVILCFVLLASPDAVVAAEDLEVLHELTVFT